MEGATHDQNGMNGRVTAVEEKFQAALNVIQNLPKTGSYKPSPQMMLKFYSYYKQATEGPCTKPKPWAWDIINKAKWDAWSKLGEMPKAKAMEEYVENLKLVMKEAPPVSDDQIVEAMPATDNVQNFIQILGDFYEIVELEPPDQFKKYRKGYTSTPIKHGDMFEPNHNDQQPRITNGHSPEDSDEQESDKDSHHENEEEQLNDHLRNGDEEAQKDGESRGDGKPSDSEDEFCDTAEDVQFIDSPMHSYTVVGMDGNHESYDKPDSESTLDSTLGSDSSNKNATHVTSSTVKVRTCGGERGSRGSDRIISAGADQSTSQQYSGSSQNPSSYSTGRQHISNGSGGNGGRPPYSYSEVQDQIAMTLAQLQQDMNSVLNRLSILEALTVGQQARRARTTSGDSGSSHTSKANSKELAMWPFTELSPKTVLFIIAWPFVAKWIMNIIAKRRLKR